MRSFYHFSEFSNESEQKNWWQVNYSGITGWVAEGSDGTYFVEPYVSAPVVTQPQTGTSTSAALRNVGYYYSPFEMTYTFLVDRV